MRVVPQHLPRQSDIWLPRTSFAGEDRRISGAGSSPVLQHGSGRFATVASCGPQRQDATVEHRSCDALPRAPLTHSARQARAIRTSDGLLISIATPSPVPAIACIHLRLCAYHSILRLLYLYQFLLYQS